MRILQAVALLGRVALFAVIGKALLVAVHAAGVHPEHWLQMLLPTLESGAAGWLLAVIAGVCLCALEIKARSPARGPAGDASGEPLELRIAWPRDHAQQIRGFPRSAEAPFDVAIVGGGIAGAALAAALGNAQLRIALLSREPPPLPAGGSLDPRVYAISPANAALLRALGAWDRIDPAQLTAVRAMRVLGDAPAARIEFDAYRGGEGELAWIVEDSRLQAALGAALAQQAGVDRMTADLRALHADPEGVTLQLEGGRSLRARLVVGADGARSAVRALSGIECDARGYGQSAVVANFACGKPHEGVAWQWFLGGPVLALLPLPGNHLSMVWSTYEAEAARLCALTIGRSRTKSPRRAGMSSESCGG